VLPDLDLRLSAIPHTVDQSLVYLSSFIGQYRGIPRAAREKQIFSRDMGIVSHFLCDSFCQAHNYSEYGNIFRHLYYETKLANKVAYSHIDELTKMSEYGLKQAGMSVRQLLDFINYNHLQYEKEDHEMATDIAYSLKTVPTVISTAIQQNMNQELAKVS
jgi:hypothetical protein